MMHKIIKATNDTVRAIVEHEISKYGYDADLNHIDVSGVTDMSGLFRCSMFTGNISDWDVSNVQDMSRMFENSKFDGDISRWNVSNVKYISHMFDCSEFTGDISRWDLSNVEDSYLETVR